MNQEIKSQLRIIFTKQINKTVSELTSKDLDLFEDWINVGLAAEHIKDIVKTTKDTNDTTDHNNSDINNSTSDNIAEVLEYKNKNKKCRNCDCLVVDVRHAKAFGMWNTLRLSTYCSYWYNKNRQYQNALHKASLNDVACTRFVSHKNVFDLLNIDISDITDWEVSNKDFSTVPVLSLLDRGHDLHRYDGVFYSTKEEEDINK